MLHRCVDVGESHAQPLSCQNGHALAIRLGMVFDVTGLSAEVESLVIVNRSRYDYVHKSVLPVCQSSVDGFKGCIARLLARFSKFYLYFLFKGCQHINAALLCAFGIVDDGEVCLDVKSLAMVGCHFRRSIYNRCTQFPHHRVFQSLEYQFISDAVSVAVRNGYAYFPVFHCA